VPELAGFGEFGEGYLFSNANSYQNLMRDVERPFTIFEGNGPAFGEGSYKPRPLLIPD
jgi:hypothetical protein